MRYLLAFIFIFFVALFSAQQKFNLTQALKLCNRDSNIYLKTESFKIETAKSGLYDAKANGNIKYNNQSIHLGNEKYFFPGTTYLNRLNTQTLHQVTKTLPWPSYYKAKVGYAKENILLGSLEYESSEYNF
jgi:hypothetical protein